MNALKRLNRLATYVPLAILITTPAVADERVKLCENISIIAHEVMMSRQEGVPMQDVMRVFNADQYGATSSEFMRKMIVDAYLKPRFMGEDFKKRASRDFADGRMVACLQ